MIHMFLCETYSLVTYSLTVPVHVMVSYPLESQLSVYFRLEFFVDTVLLANDFSFSLCH